MRLIDLAILALTPLTHAANIILSNDDGWAELNIRTFYTSLKTAGNNALISAPARDGSGTGSADVPATPLLFTGCEFDSCPRGSPAEGFNASDPGLNYVNSFPVTAMKYGIKTLAPKLFNGGAVDVAVTGPNVGVNTGTLFVQFSGTVGAATEAVKEGIPAIAFSGTTGDKIAWNVPAPPYVGIYADLATNVTDTLLASSKPYLPTNVWLNVNFGAVGDTTCTQAADFRFVLTRIGTAVPVFTPDDVETCGKKRLPREEDVVKMAGCYASVSVGKADSKADAGAAEQGVVLGKLGGLLTCLP
ncbi:uncharacterized protein KY384_000385 [Bacidia gigantensis]|uniref:uncharacterized protein n=1 Tax=Bacidia gigantensis TaxID=2732470 RepID=UPI001D044DAA|nr:uncharacterized protein KY384_000385 [Bacidia gigantensis]KAG8526391.1 hypothetical protein KY384_000385 [Bacidia gigantensis]